MTFIIYYLSNSPSSLITESVTLVGKGRLKERCGLEPRTDFFFRLRNRQNLVRIRFENIRYLFNKLSFVLFYCYLCRSMYCLFVNVYCTIDTG